MGSFSMRAGRPRSQEGESQKPSRKAKADAVGGGAGPPSRGIDIFFIVNIDAQDEQDEQDERFLHEKLAYPIFNTGTGDWGDFTPILA